MAVRVRLQDVIEGMEFQSDEMTSYLNRKTGQVVTIGDEYFWALEFGDENGPRADWEPLRFLCGSLGSESPAGDGPIS